jgi:hypothetical protein
MPIRHPPPRGWRWAVGRAALALFGGADEDGDLPEVLVLVHELMGLRDLVEAHRTPQHRADLALLDERLARLHCHALAKCEPMICFWRIHR